MCKVLEVGQRSYYRWKRSPNSKRALRKEKFKATTDSKHNYQVVENVLDRKFEPSNPSEAWVSDITYITVKEGFYRG